MWMQMMEQRNIGRGKNWENDWENDEAIQLAAIDWALLTAWEKKIQHTTLWNWPSTGRWSLAAPKWKAKADEWSF